MITMDDIVREGHPALRTVTEEVPLPPSDEDKKTLEEMVQYLKNSQDEQVCSRYGLRRASVLRHRRSM